MAKYNEKQLIEVLQKNGLTVTQVDTKHYINKGYVQSGDPLKSLLKTAEQVFEDVSVTGRGKKREYTVGRKMSKVTNRIDYRVFNSGGGRKVIGRSTDLVQRPEYDAEFCEYMREKYNTYRISQQMILLEYGYDTYQCKLPSSYRRGESGNYIYRFLNEDQEVIYIGLTSEINSRMYQHFNSGHLSDEAYDEVETIEYIEVSNKMIMNILETYLINKYQPKHNTVLKYDTDDFETIVCLDELDTGWKKHRYERREQKDE